MSMEQILTMYLDVKYAPPIRRTICPICAYTIDDTERGLHCKFCGWSENPVPMPFVPRTPEEPHS